MVHITSGLWLHAFSKIVVPEYTGMHLGNMLVPAYICNTFICFFNVEAGRWLADPNLAISMLDSRNLSCQKAI